MRYQITHSTTYHYGETVPVCHNQVHLTPREGARQSCRSHRLIIKPAPQTTDRRLDYFGNPVSFFAIQEGHHRLSVTAISKVEVFPAPVWNRDSFPPWEQVRADIQADRTPAGLAAYQFAFDSPRVAASEAAAEYARLSFTPNRNLLDALQELTARIHADFRYDASATTVHTPLEEVFRIRKGVCQDLAHVQLACVRSLGLSGRYVSGYLRTIPPAGQPRLVGADASHAWLSIYCPLLGWVDLDPTNNVVPSTDHITLAWGRDYSDVCPIKGVVLGGGRQGMTVAVDVVPVERFGTFRGGGGANPSGA